MPLIAAQREWEIDWAKRLVDVTKTLDVDKWIKYYKDDATSKRPGIREVKGKEEISETLGGMACDVSIVIEEEGSKIVYIVSSTVALVSDPEKQKLSSRSAVIIKKALGAGEEQLTSEEVFSDASAMYKRLGALGIDVLANMGQK